MEKEPFSLPMFFLVILLALVTLIAFWQVMDMVILGLLVAVVVIPAYRYVSRYIRPSLSVTLLCAALFPGLAVAVLGTVDILSANSPLVKGQLQAIQQWVVDPRTDLGSLGIPVEGRQISDWIDASQLLLADYWLRISEGSFVIFLKVAIFFASLGLFLWKGDRIRDNLLAVIPKSLISPVDRLSSISVDCLHAIFVVHIIMAVITFLIAIPFFYLLGWGNVLFYSFLTFVCELVPILGASVVMIYLGGYALAIGNTHAFLILLLVGYTVVALAPEIFIRPVLTGRRVHIHPVVMIVGFFGGILTMGMIGFVLGPLLLTLLISGYRIFVEEKPFGEWWKGIGLNREGGGGLQRENR
jgi:predicted PurR-regulated permease PerM